MAYTALAVANSLLKLARKDESGESITPMKLQKLVYFANAWNLYIHDEPLVVERFYKWTYGPVVPGLYSEFRDYGRAPITSYGTRPSRSDPDRNVTPVVPDDDRETWRLLRKVWREYGHMDGIDLSALSHHRDGAWRKAEDEGPLDDDEIIREIEAIHQS
ncbi:Panacea domain-containing protein [Achromobacter sp. ACRQX]|uniref:Panacea domain-containing protein n=1 Tax=Achromobacter sp. ACRQX TaxID=2918181 RepID=UPI001EF29591|nr:type II toxin-antitoxin system antitoxin SocA domain-containing protein [Achromobacter sp. ACRQX]MCG7324260.1 DUF4065 domain-containing protein [Achromobacter sp. ACRQX]